MNTQGYSSNAGIDASDIRSHLSEISSYFQSMAQSGGQSLSGEATVTKLGGVPAVQGTFSGASGGAKVTITFRDGTEYLVTCQFVPDERSEILKGCSEILSSFEFVAK